MSVSKCCRKPYSNTSVNEPSTYSPWKRRRTEILCSDAWNSSRLSRTSRTSFSTSSRIKSCPKVIAPTIWLSNSTIFWSTRWLTWVKLNKTYWFENTYNFQTQCPSIASWRISLLDNDEHPTPILTHALEFLVCCTRYNSCFRECILPALSFPLLRMILNYTNPILTITDFNRFYVIIQTTRIE